MDAHWSTLADFIFGFGPKSIFLIWMQVPKWLAWCLLLAWIRNVTEPNLKNVQETLFPSSYFDYQLSSMEHSTKVPAMKVSHEQLQALYVASNAKTDIGIY